MKFIFIFIFLVINVFAVGQYPSDIPLPKTEVIKMNVKNCDDICLATHIYEGRVFSFLSNYNSSFDDVKELKENFNILKSLFNLEQNDNAKVKVAILLPRNVIGRYAESTVTTILTYLATQCNDFDIEVFNSNDEDYTSIRDRIREIESHNFRKVIAIVTNDGLKEIAKVQTSLLFYVPTINKNSNDVKSSNIIYAGIDYEAQIDKLLTFANNKISIFYDGSVVSNNLTNAIKDRRLKDITYEKEIKNSQSEFKNILNTKNIDNSSIFLNTPLVRSSVLVSGITYYNREPKNILSTQINYKPLILDLTQQRDRENMLIANSITKRDFDLEEYNNLLLNDISYDWINYTTSVCVDEIVSKEIKKSSIYKVKATDNTIEYDIKIYQPLKSKLEERLELEQNQ